MSTTDPKKKKNVDLVPNGSYTCHIYWLIFDTSEHIFGMVCSNRSNGLKNHNCKVC